MFGVLCRQVEPDPNLATVRRGLQQILQFQPDVIIAIGGGSPMDAAKGALTHARARAAGGARTPALPAARAAPHCPPPPPAPARLQ